VAELLGLRPRTVQLYFRRRQIAGLQLGKEGWVTTGRALMRFAEGLPPLDQDLEELQVRVEELEKRGRPTRPGRPSENLTRAQSTGELTGSLSVRRLG
jgi:hypothetical protein